MNKLINISLFSLSLGLLQTASAGLSLFACEPEWAALAKALAMPDANVFSATSHNQDPHHVQARPALIAAARNADLLICTGAGLEEGWLPMVLRKASNSKVMPGNPGYVAAADQVALLEKPQTLDRSQGDIHAAGNPHIQTDPRNLLPVAKALSKALAAVDPAHAADYGTRLNQFERDWQLALSQWQQQAKKLAGTTVVVHHNQWVYLSQWLGLQTLATLEPKPGVPPNAGYLAELKQKLAAKPAQIIIRSPLDDPRPGDWLAEQTGANVLTLPFTVESDDGSKALQQMFEQIIAQLASN